MEVSLAREDLMNNSFVDKELANLSFQNQDEIDLGGQVGDKTCLEEFEDSVIFCY